MTAPSAASPSDDDVSVSTSQAENRHITYTGESKEYVVKFMIRPKGINNNTAVAKTHYAVLCSISDIYPDEVQIFNSFGKTIKEFPVIKSNEAYLRHYKLQFVKANESKRRSAIYLVFHRIRSTVPISEIRRHDTIHELLQKVNTRLTIHHWSEDETRIANLGFFVTYDPTNIPQEELEDWVRTTISATTKKPVKKIPRFRCCFSSPYFVSNSTNTRTSTKAYDLQCHQQDAQELINLLKTTYQSNPIFIFHRIRHKNPKVYRAGIRRQNEFLYKSRVVLIQGVSMDIMWYLASELCQIEEVFDVTSHRHTATTGRWNVLTTAEHFKRVTSTISDRLVPLVSMIATDRNLDLSMTLEPGLAFKAQAKEEESEGSFQFYVSACSSILSVAQEDLTVEATTYKKAPVGSSPAPQAWSTVPAVVHAAPASSPSSSALSQESLDIFLAENACLMRIVSEQSTKIQQLLSAQGSVTASNHPQPPPAVSHTPSHPNLPHGLDLDQIIAATTRSVLPALSLANAGTLQYSTPAHPSTQPGSDLSTRPNATDMSFEQDDAVNHV